MAVRRAAAGDAAALAGLMTELGYPSSTRQVAARLPGLGGPDHALFVAEDDRTVVGCIHLHRAETLASGTIAEILSFVVQVPVRDRGHGGALLGAGLEWAQASGAAELRVRARLCREQAHAFYLSHGFMLAKQQMVFVRPLAGG